jgi:hypothetical protein
MKRLLFVATLLCLVPFPVGLSKGYTPRDAHLAKNWKKMFAEPIPDLIGGEDSSPRAAFCNDSGSFERCTSCCIAEDSLWDTVIGTGVVILAAVLPPGAAIITGAAGVIAGSATGAQNCINTYCEGLSGDPSVTTCGYNGTGICANFHTDCWVGEPDPVCVSPLQCWCNEPPPNDEPL